MLKLKKISIVILVVVILFSLTMQNVVYAETSKGKQQVVGYDLTTAKPV